MKAVYIQQHGPVSNLKLSDIPKPSLREGEVLVQVQASGLNRSDVLSAEGSFHEAKLPRVIGRDFAGVIVDGPKDLNGAEVWGSGGDLGITRDGTDAEYLAIPLKAVARRPKNLSADEAGSAGLPFVTAFSALFTVGQLKKNEWVIVSGAAGAVGQAAIQLAHAKGAQVIALIKNESERRLPKADGVRAVASSEKGDLEEVVRQATNGAGADLALNGVGASIFGQIFASLKNYGRHVVYSSAGGREATVEIHSFYRKQLALLGLNTVLMDVCACAPVLNEIAPQFESGAVKPPVIEERYPISDVAKAYSRVAKGGSGKIVFVMPASEDASRAHASSTSM
jgi:NADPH:quinone reductase